MELSDLRVFRAVVETGGVTRAAERLHRVPSNVTTRIKNLEKELGIALFLREGRRMQLSPAGRLLLDHAERLLAMSEQVRDALHGNPYRGVLRLGSMESTAAARLPAALCVFHERYPEMALELAIGDPRQLTARLLSGELDAALVAEPVLDTTLETLPVYDEQLVIISQAGHRRIGTPQDLGKRSMLAFHHGCPYRRRFEEWFARSGVQPERVVELASYHAILGCAAAGMGAAMLPRSVLDTYTERSRLGVHKLDASLGAMRILLAWRKKAKQAKIAALAQVLVSASAGRAARRGKQGARAPTRRPRDTAG